MGEGGGREGGKGIYLEIFRVILDDNVDEYCLVKRTARLSILGWSALWMTIPTFHMKVVAGWYVPASLSGCTTILAKE